MQNNQRFRKTAFILLMIILYLLAGYFRDTFFKNLNSQIDVANGNSVPFEFSAGMTFLGELTAKSLVNLKWIMTVIFTLIFLLLGIITIRLFLKNKKNLRLLLFAYSFIFILAGIVLVTGKVFSGWEEKTFGLSRDLLHALQSPLIIMILIPVLLISQRKSTE